MVFSRLLCRIFSVIGCFCMAFVMFLACVFLYAVIAVSETHRQKLPNLRSPTG